MVHLLGLLKKSLILQVTGELRQSIYGYLSVTTEDFSALNVKTGLFYMILIKYFYT